MADRQIHGAVLQSGRIYKAGDEEALALVLPRPDVDRLVAKGVLSGDWTELIPEAVSPASAPAKPSTKKRK